MDTANKEVVWIRKLWRDGSSGPGWLPIDIGYGGDRIRQGNFRLATGLTSGGIRNDGMLVSCNEISGNQEARMDAMALGKWGGCAAVMAAIIVAIACSSGPKPAAPIVASRPECPVDSVDILVVDTLHGVPTPRHITNIPVAGPITNIPEFHDCQRFIGNTGGDLKYGPLVAIFANHLLDSLYIRQFDPTSAEAQQAAGEIYSYDRAYDPLYIQQGFNCLYLRKKAPGNWEAQMVPVGNDEKACLTSHRGKTLTVVSKQLMHDEKDVPPVARWDYDTVHHRQYIGIKCGEEWCEIGQTGFETSAGHHPGILRDEPIPSATLAPATPTEKARVVLVKGWYDEQYLAEGTTGDLRPMHVRGTAFPHPMLDRLKNVSDFSVKWILSAYLLLDSDPGPYKSKLNLDQGVNRMYLCEGAFKDCPGVPPGTKEPKCPNGADHRWWAKIISARGDSVYRCVHRRIHSGEEIPGAVRWRWKEDDETMWVRCPQGCCTVN